MTKQSKPALETAKLKATRSKARNSEAVTSETGQSKNTIGRRSVLAAAVAGAGLTFFGPWKHNRVWAASQKPILMGLTHDASGFLAASGAAEKRGTIMAIEEANARGGVLGRNIEYVWMDTESTPATASRVAERMITRDEVSFIVGALLSGAANAISQVAQKYGCIYFNTNSSSPTESGKNCHRTKFVWDGSGANFARATASNAVSTFGKDWLLLTNDIVWGHNTSKATRDILDGLGASVKEEILIPVGTRDYSSILIKIQQAKPQVVSTALGGDDFKALREQVTEMKLDKQMAWLSNQLDWPDFYRAGPDAAFGVFGATWYHYLDLPGVADFVAKYKARWPESEIHVPGNVYYNGYMGMRELILAIERADSTNNIKIIKALEGHKMTAVDRMQHFDAWIDPDSHHVQQGIYLAAGNDKPRDKTDRLKIIGMGDPMAVADANESSCKLESYADTPTYET